MSRFIRLDTAITDSTAPRVLHAVGASGYTHRYVPSVSPQAAGSALSVLRDEIGTDHLTPFAGSAGITIESESSVKFARLAQVSGAGGILQGSASISSTAMTMVAVIRADYSGAASVSTVGRRIGRGGNGVFSFYFTESGTPGGSGTINPPASPTGWFCAIAGTDAGATAFRSNSAAPATSTTPIVPGGMKSSRLASYNSAAALDVREFVVFERKLDTAEMAAVYTAMKNRYPDVA